jgi:hypothetical protein
MSTIDNNLLCIPSYQLSFPCCHCFVYHVLDLVPHTFLTGHCEQSPCSRVERKESEIGET